MPCICLISDLKRVISPGLRIFCFHPIMQQANAEGKKYVNLGLGINPGVAFFKEKWGGSSFSPMPSVCTIHPERGFWR